MKALLLFLLLFSSISSAQTKISGTITDSKNQPLMGVNVYLEGTYDGAMSDVDGKFVFTTSETGPVILIASFIGYEEFRRETSVATLSKVAISLRESMNALNTVVLSAGSFSAGDSSKASVLKPLDIVTTAGAAGDFLGALQTLPGTTANPDDGRLFVRGGTADETQIFVDGNRVFSPYTPSTGNIPTRGRFSPFLFDGITFSTGGYSAEYGDALSSVLLLNTTNFPIEEKTEVQLMTVGVGAGNTQIWEENSLSVNATYINLAPYNEIIPQNNQFIDPFQSASGEAVYRHKTNKGLFKAYGAFSYSDFSLIQEDINVEDGFFFGLRNRNYYGNLNYTGELSESWEIQSGVSLSKDHTDLNLTTTKIDNSETAVNGKVKVSKRYNNYFKMHYGAEQFVIDSKESILFEQENFNNTISQYNTGAFVESELFASKDLAFKIGGRADYYNTTQQIRFSPRLSAAISISDNTQISAAYGMFHQQIDNSILQYDSSLETEKAEHFILNFLHKKNNRMLRAEAYYKKYDNLLTYDTSRPAFNSNYENGGDGYATGLDIFWRDEQSIKNLEYWVSYSFLDTERLYRNYPQTATPQFATDHNLSIVTKYWVDDLQSQIGFTYNYASGRPFTNANQEGFLNDKTTDFQSLDFNWAYLLDDSKILYLSVSNVMGRDNIFGYQYSNAPDVQGQFDRRAIGQAADRFIFVGFFWTIGGSDNQLDNL
ncbi:Outer membrane cobalamin receptor protein [Nonlabens sp. Hel1_33_55]|uniref:TonB-dependent receptor n=1 Tax=Nonlabens sp. Hel1_33_55 TaxID=1336802 RepID=UPI000875B99B|nr:TonB-dependent receptor [Nonlabens sp. Hel1_33_55]SCY34238.1 Outer membrane cobalamin receptor protein [Nonlabens sp. Hel1_33_55]